MEKKIGVYICEGCGIADAINVEALEKGVRNFPVKRHKALCSPEGVEVIRNDMKNDGINTLVIAACSPRVKYDVFDFPGSIVERVNIRELVAWTLEPKDELTQAAAEDYLKMGIVKVQKSDLPEPWVQETVKTILVIGGGVTGLTSALEAAKAGYKVYLVEKEPELGGFARRLYKQVSRTYPYKLTEPTVGALIKEVESHPNIQVFKASKVIKTDGQPGMWDVTIQTNGKEETIRIGAIVLAAGWKPYDATKLEHLGYGRIRDVVTNIEFEEMAKKGRLIRPSDGKEVKRVVFVQCAGSRDPNHLPYCSAYCCGASLKQAKYVRELSDDSVAVIVYKDIRTPGQYEFFYKEVQNDPGIMLTKGEVTGVYEENGKLYVEADQTLFMGDKIRVEADLVVLAIGMVPATRESQEYLEGLRLASVQGDEAKKAYIEQTPKPEFILNLNYRQGPEIPPFIEKGSYGFADSNFICFQYETRRTGIYAAGCVRQPMTIAEAQDDGAGAALKAIQAAEHVAKGIAVHPRAWDMTYPDPLLLRCTACKRCTEECPFGAIDEDEKGIPYYKPNRCRRCATCLGACPERIVSFKDYSVDMISSMIKSIDVPEDGLMMLAFVCENDAYPAFDTAGINRLKLPPNLRVIPLRCLGSMNLVWIADALSRGIDGAILFGCKFGEDYQCHFVKGSELANYRLGKVQETLGRLQLESERVRMVQLSIADYNKLPEIINEFVEKINELGPNPYKGF
jgi:quinone-modifying oxidoreductase subunit QmoB